MRLIDTHTHLDFPDFDADRPRLLANAAARGLERMVVLGVYQANFQRVWELACAEPRLFAALGLHPVYLDQHRPEHLVQLREWLERLRDNPRLCAVGEFGLDYYLADLDKTRQQALFEAQLQMACDFELPALLHVRQRRGNFRQMLRAVAYPRVHRRCHVRCISLQHHTVQWQPRQSLAQPQRLRPGTRTAQPKQEAQLDVLAGLFVAAGKRMNHPRPRWLVALECGNHLGMATAHVQQGR